LREKNLKLNLPLIIVKRSCLVLHRLIRKNNLRLRLTMVAVQQEDYLLLVVGCRKTIVTLRTYKTNNVEKVNIIIDYYFNMFSNKLAYFLSLSKK
jgi:hypothetical protein